MHVRFNGQQIDCLKSQTLEMLLKSYSIEKGTPGIAVAVNERIITRKEWPELLIKPGDCIEVVHAVQGG